MKMFVYGIRDKVADDILQLMLHHKDAMAYRYFEASRQSLKENPDKAFYRYEDLELVKLGSLDIETLQLESLNPVERVCNGFNEGI